LVEEPTRFSDRPLEQLAAAAGLGVANLAGVSWLRWALAQEGVIPQGPITPWISAVSGFLVGYAVCYLALPLARLAVVAFLNSRVEARNAARREMAEELTKRRAA
jgi:hypothetical protein